MSILVGLQHKTRYRYDKRISLGPQTIRLKPSPHCKLPVSAYSIKIKPENHFINWQQDPLGNYLANVVIPEKTSEFEINVDLKLKISPRNPFDFFIEENYQAYPFEYGQELEDELYPYLRLEHDNQEILKFITQLDLSKQKTIDLLVTINRILQQTIEYQIRLEPGIQTCSETLTSQRGSCRDLAWLQCQILRHIGFATRFASGYLIQLRPDEKPIEGPAGPNEDVADLHAWTEVYLPGAGWIGLDATSGLLVSEGHIPLCATPDPQNSAPISGTLEQCEADFEFSMQVERISEEPRISKPYTQQEWQNISKLGDAIDAKLLQQDMRLTMGGEPTFVSIDDYQSEQWTVAALGQDKSNLAKQLITKLQNKLAKNAVIMHSQGKWYNSEPLPRWALHCFWRKDGEVIWQQNQTKNADINANQYMQTLCGLLGIAEKSILQAVETDGEAAGFCLPLRWSTHKHQWLTCKWPMQNKVELIPGDSPLGLRLPLDQLPETKEDPEEIPEPSLFVNQPPLPTAADLENKIQQRKPAKSSYSKEIFRTTLCVQAKTDHINIFVPPINSIEQYLELQMALSIAATKCDVAIELQGYPPPKDNRIQQFSITPDPGVIEVNIHPAKTWRSLTDNITTLYKEAKQCRLSTEKFTLDGRMVGTGGGNHITLGGITTNDSPFLRRPDLLQSLITFWQHHPSMSYLFSGLFVGPTCQAPRVDEARHDALYELEIAFAQIAKKQNLQFWDLDRMLRNLLVDLTGNTHRAEICIDKLYNPDTSFGRQGLVELRGFEMPPHPRMCLTQYLLVKALLSCFWDQPYHHNLKRWGTQLHDRFMLPHYIWQDFKEVIAYLNQRGFSFDLDWFKPFYYFRFPVFGTSKVNDLQINLQLGLEPWNVLGEESSSGSTSRGVDSAQERLQVKVTGALKDNLILTCNGYKLPLQQTEKHNEYVAGVRFKAWKSTYTLHPNMPIHTPLVFDVVDLHNQHSLGGCTYHVAHPGGKSYEEFPVNEREALARQACKFEDIGHTPGKVNKPKAIENSEFPHTLDLRRAD